MSERTPGPWRAERDTVWTPQGLMFVLPFRQEGPANAEFIVRACNAHDALVAALTSATGWLVEVCSESDEGNLSELRECFPAEWKMIDKARAALELARVRPLIACADEGVGTDPRVSATDSCDSPPLGAGLDPNAAIHDPADSIDVEPS